MSAEKIFVKIFGIFLFCLFTLNRAVLSSASGSASFRTIPSHSQEWEDLNSFEVSSSFICFRSVSGSTQLSRQSSSAWSEVRRSLRVELSSA